MINRRQLQCISCGTKIVTRTGIGHGNVQKHKFACPKCGIEIGFILNLDQKAVTFDYEKPKNANWIDSDEESSLTVLFYPELMIPKNLTYPISPFIVTVGNYKNIQEYQAAEAVRRHIKDEIWPVLQRVYIHFENKNLDLLKKDGAKITQNFPSLKDDEERAGWLVSATRHYFDFFVADLSAFEAIGRAAAKATIKNEQALRTFAEQYVTSGRMIALWKELKSVRRQFIDLYESLLPILMVRRYWKEEQQDITQYELSVKNFEDLKGFYIDCVETSFRLLVIGLAVVLIDHLGAPIISTSKGDKDIWWFEQMQNGIKNTQLNKYPVFAPIMSALDLGLRNGVGHHSAHYEVTTDEIVYVKADEANLNEVRIPYTSFVGKVFGAYCAFELATIFFDFLFVAGNGRL